MGKQKPVQKDQKEHLKKLQGIVKVNSRGIGYIASPQAQEEVEIDTYFLKSALHGDEVLYLVHPKIKNKPLAGEVVKVIRRAKKRFVGTLEKSGEHYFLNPDDRRMYRDIIIQESDKLQETIGKKVLVEINSWGDHKKNPEGKIIKIFGNKGEHEVEIQSILFDKGFDPSFPEAVSTEAEKVAKEAEGRFASEINQRKDFRQTATFTIDPLTAKDFDDALSFKKIAGNQELYEIGIHIADVSYYVRENTLLDSEAKERGFSMYLVDRTVPMLPEVLSNHLCSLNPNEDRLAFSAVFTLNNKAQVLESWFGKTVIRSQKRFSYEEAQKTLNEKTGQFFTELEVLDTLAKILKTERFRKGAIDFDAEEVSFELDSSGRPLRVFKKARLDTHKLVEEFMLLANRHVAEFMSEDPYIQYNPFLYRIHDLPDKEKMRGLSIFVRSLGYHLPLSKKGQVSSKDLNALFKKMEGEAEESLIKTAAVRSMAKAVYSMKNGNHFGLAFEYYTHFTSPIRRYADLMVHRFLEKRLAGKKFKDKDFSHYQKLALDLSEKETRIAEAERESIKFKQAEYMREHLGIQFQGIISGITEWGIYVEERETKTEGLIKLRDLTDDFYILDEKNYRLVGRSTQKKYQLGDKVRIKVKAVDLERKLIDYELVS